MNEMQKMIAIAKKFVGGSSGSAEVVILPETVLTADPDSGQVSITTPLQAPVADGDVVSINYNGTAYECTGVDVEGMGVGFGNLTAAGLEGGNPDAPFVVVLAPEGGEQDNEGVISYIYGIVIPMDGSTSITLSIIKTGEADSGGESAGGGAYIATVTGEDNTNLSADKSYDATKAAILGGKMVCIRLENETGTFLTSGLGYAPSTDRIIAAVHIGTATMYLHWEPDGNISLGT